MRPLGWSLAAALLLFEAVVARAITYDDPRAAAKNRSEINAAWAEGKILNLAGGAVYVDDELVQPPLLGGGLRGGGMAYLLGEEQYGAEGLGGQVTRIIRTTPGACIVRAQGSHLDLSNLALIGSRMKTFGAIDAPRTKDGILVEGRDPPSSGKLCVTNVLVGLCETAIHFAATPQEQHADESTWTRVWGFGCDTFVRSDNQQAVSHHFYSCGVGGRFSGVNEHMKVFDYERGGNLYCAGLIINHPKVTLLRLSQWSPNTNRFDVVGFRYDTPTVEPKGLRLVEWENPYGYDPTKYANFDVRISGHIAEAKPSTAIGDMVRLGGLSGDSLWFDVTNLPAGAPEGYRRSADGPWVRFREQP
jgi:hypothetical protein